MSTKTKSRGAQASGFGPSESHAKSSTVAPQREYKTLLQELDIARDSPSATSLGFVRNTGVKENRIFLQSLRANPDAKRLLERILPQCDIENLAAFAVLSVHRGVGEGFVGDRNKRGKKLKAALKKRIRKTQAQLRSQNIIDPFGHREKQLEVDKQILTRAEQAFDTRRMGLTKNWPFLLVIFEYLRFRSGLTPRPRDMGALLAAAYAASGNPRIVDSDLLIRGLRRYSERHPNFSLSGSSAARIVERLP
jgi:hypothetical protein